MRILRSAFQSVFRRLSISLLLLLFAAPPLLRAQLHESALSDAEIEKLRESADAPSDRVLLFVKFLDLRSDEVKDLYAHPRKPGREQDTHDLLEQFTSIADELDDNLDDYGPRHSDIRKALPKLLQAAERWSSALKSPPGDEAYNVSRNLALDAVRDLREAATQLTEEQAAWFKAHPPAKEQPHTVEVPR
jgi:hypothetical protein